MAHVTGLLRGVLMESILVLVKESYYRRGCFRAEYILGGMEEVERFANQVNGSCYIISSDGHLVAVAAKITKGKPSADSKAN